MFTWKTLKTEVGISCFKRKKILEAAWTVIQHHKHSMSLLMLAVAKVWIWMISRDCLSVCPHSNRKTA